MLDLVIIFSFVLVVTIISFIFGNTIHKRQLAYKERRDAIERNERGGNSAGSDAKIAKLEERVRVLERIATDGKQDLAVQIESLRDLQELDDLTARSADKQEVGR